MEQDSAPPRTSAPPGSENAPPRPPPQPAASSSPEGIPLDAPGGDVPPRPSSVPAAPRSGSLHPFAAEDLAPEAREALDALCLDQRRRWLSGERPPVETYFARRPELAERPAELIELIYNEFLIREELVDRPDSQEFFARFPQCKEALRRQFELHAALQGDDAWGFPPGDSADSASASRSSSLFPGFPSSAPEGRSGAASPPVGEGEGGRFEMLRRIGAGGMGVVYAAYDRLWRQPVALKTLHRQDPAALWRLKQEFRVLADQSHPNLVQLFELFVDEGRAYFTMEYVEGRDFVSWCTSAGRPSPSPPTAAVAGDPTPAAAAEAGAAAADETAPSFAAFPAASPGPPTPQAAPFADAPFPEAAVREAVRQLIDGLRAVHEADKLHCDLKPSNVLVSSAGRVVLLDFGMAHDLRQADPSRAAAKREGTDPAAAGKGAADYLRGTIAYLAPERFRGGGASRAADWYAVGVMLYQVLTGRTPFGGDAAEMVRAKLRGDPVHPREFGSRASPELERLCLDWLSRDPALRPSADEALSRLAVAPAAAAHARREDLETLVGRGEALQMLHSALQETVRSGRGRRLLVHGESGMGKTALVRRFASEVESTAQGRVISGRCREHESIPFKAVDALLDHLAQTLVRMPEADVVDVLPSGAGALADLFPALQRVPAVEAARRMHPPSVDPVLRRTAAFRALGELLANLARSRPLVVWIDDVQWGDGDSARLLVFTLRAAEKAPVLWLACGRSEHLAESPFLCELRAALGADVFPEWPLPPLAPEDAAQLARRHLTAPESAAASAGSNRHARLIARQSSGNPFLILELARGGEGAAEAAPASDAAPVPAALADLAAQAQSAGVLLPEEGPSSGSSSNDGASGGSTSDARARTAARRSAEDGRIDRVLWARIEQTTAAAQRLLEVVSTAGGPLTLATACRAAEVEDDPQKALMELRAGRLIRTWRRGGTDLAEPYHDRIREGVVRRLAPEAMRARHRGLAEAFEAEDEPDPRPLARHYHAAQEPIKAAQYAEAAGRAAFEAAAFDEAAQFLRLAVERSADGTEKDSAPARMLADALAWSGRGGEAGALYERLAADAPPAEAAVLRSRAVEHLLRSGHFSAGADVFRNLIQSLGLVWPKSDFDLLWRFLLLRTAIAVRGLGFRLRPAGSIRPEALRKVDGCWTAGNLLGHIDIPRCFYYMSMYVWHALRSGEGGRIARALALEALTSTALKNRDFARVQRLHAQAADLAARSGDPRVVGAVDMLHCGSWFYVAEWEQVVVRTTAVLAYLRSTCRGQYYDVGHTYVYRMHALFNLGRWKQLRREADVCMEDARQRGDLFHAAEVRTSSTNVAWLAADDVEGAEAALRFAVASRPKRDEKIENFVDLIARVHIDLYRGDGGAAWATMRRAWPAQASSGQFRVEIIHAEMAQLRVRAALAALAEGVPDVKPILAAIAEDLRVLSSGSLAGPKAAGMLHAASLAALQGRRVEAIAGLEQAAAACERARLALYASAARRRQGELQGGPEGDALTSAADAHFAEEGIRRPERMIHVLAPGFFAKPRR